MEKDRYKVITGGNFKPGSLKHKIFEAQKRMYLYKFAGHDVEKLIDHLERNYGKNDDYKTLHIMFPSGKVE